MYTLNVKINGNFEKLQTTDNTLEISNTFIAIPYQNIMDIIYTKGSLMKKSTITLIYLENNYQNRLDMEVKGKHKEILEVVNVIKQNILNTTNYNNQIPPTNNDNNYIPMNTPPNNVFESLSVYNGAIKGKLEIYEDYYKIYYNNTFNIIYYNQLYKVELRKKTGHTSLVFIIRTEYNDPYEEYWHVQKILNMNKLENILNFINQKIMQNNQENNINGVKVISNYDSNNRIFFIGNMIEGKSTLIGRTNKIYKIITYLEPDYMLIQKISAFTNKDRGDKKIPYVDISSIDFDKSGTFGITSGIDITISGSEMISLKSFSDNTSQNFYNMLTKAIQERKKPQESHIIQDEIKSNADELLKWHELYEKGVITEEEFNQKKMELL